MLVKDHDLKPQKPIYEKKPVPLKPAHDCGGDDQNLGNNRRSMGLGLSKKIANAIELSCKPVAGKPPIWNYAETHRTDIATLSA